MNPYEIIKGAHLTEKSTLLGEKHNQYVFKVDPRANKIQIRKAIEEIFKVKVIAVRTLNTKPKLKRKGQAPEGYTPRWKKAIVTLKEGDKIVLT